VIDYSRYVSSEKILHPRQLNLQRISTSIFTYDRTTAAARWQQTRRRRRKNPCFISTTEYYIERTLNVEKSNLYSRYHFAFPLGLARFYIGREARSTLILLDVAKQRMHAKQ